MLKNELLQKAQAEVEKNVEDRASYDKILSAGTKVIYNQATFAKLTAGLAESEDPVADVAKGIVALLNILARQARGTMPPVPTVQAGMALLFDAVDFMEQAGVLQVTPETLDTAATEYMEALLPTLGLTPDRLGEVLASVQETMSDPSRMDAYQQQAGGAR